MIARYVAKSGQGASRRVRKPGVQKRTVPSGGRVFSSALRAALARRFMQLMTRPLA